MRGLLLIAALALPSPLLAEQVQPIVVMSNPAAVALEMRELGFRAKLEKSENDRPLIKSGVGGVKFEITFYGCKDDVECTGLLFTAGFDLRQGTELEVANKWNGDRLVGRAFLDETCDPIIDHFLIADPVMSKKAFEWVLSDWETALADFKDFIDFEGEDSTSSRVADCGEETDAI